MLRKLVWECVLIDYHGDRITLVTVVKQPLDKQSC